jgi:hypothetical protein
MGRVSRAHGIFDLELTSDRAIGEKPLPLEPEETKSDGVLWENARVYSWGMGGDSITVSGPFCPADRTPLRIQFVGADGTIDAQDNWLIQPLEDQTRWLHCIDCGRDYGFDPQKTIGIARRKAGVLLEAISNRRRAAGRN